MKLGLDLDNTLIDYDRAAQAYAEDNGIGSIGSLADLRATLTCTSDLGWQKAQAWIYTYGLKFATPANGWSNFLSKSAHFNLEIFIVSHKTNFTPKAFGSLDLHLCARNWLENVLKIYEIPQIKNVYFEPTREKKIAKIAQLKLDFFVDDLPEVLNHPSFPKGVMKVLYNSDCSQDSIPSIRSFEALLKVLCYE